MPIVVQCPSCNRQLRVPDDLLGRSVKCPSCNTMFTASASEGEVPAVTPVAPQSEPGGVTEYGRPHDGLSAAKAPAICLLVTGILGFLMDAYSIVNAATSKPGEIPAGIDPQTAEAMRKVLEILSPSLLMTIGAIFAFISLLIVLSAVMMLKGRMRGLAITGSILAMLNLGNCCCLLGIPFGIWSLVVLMKPEVRDAFT